MEIIRKGLICLLLIICSSNLKADPSSADKLVFIGALIEDHDQLVPYFLKTLDQIDYDKNAIILQLNVCNDNPQVYQQVKEWANSHQKNYKEIILGDLIFPPEGGQLNLNKAYAYIKDDYLAQSLKLGCSHCFILSSETYILPHTLKHLLRKNKPIIAPLLRPFPESNDPISNFFADVTEWGYYKEHPLYQPISSRNYQGTFKVPCVHGVYLIQSQYANELSFTKNLADWEFLVFSKGAREKNIGQFICNEKEFGFLLHFYETKPREELKNFAFINPEAEITPALLATLLSKFILDDPSLKDKLEHFNYSDYAIFRVKNQNLFYLDDVHDYIKSYILKRNLNWEEHIHDEFKKHAIPGTTVLDIGSHLGTHTLNLSRIIGDKGTVHAFEPQAKLFCELAINMHLNHCQNVVLHHNALGSEEKWIEMQIPKESWTAPLAPTFVNEGRAVINEFLHNTTGDRAKIVRLDDLKLNNVSFIKMDVEGFEMEVIKGGLETIKTNMPTMIIEIFNDPQKDQKIAYIVSLGYSFQPLGGDDYLFIPKQL